MKKRVFFCALLMLMSCFTVAAQQATQQAAQPLTFWYEYHVNPGKEEEFLNLVKAVGQPVRDKLMAEGVVLAWGVESPLLRVPENATHMIWYTVADYAGLEKVDTAMREQIAKMTEESTKAPAGKKGAAAGGGPMEHIREITDFAKTHDYLTRDLVSGFAPGIPPAGVLPFTRYNFVKVKPGKGAEYRKAWEKYNKPVFDKLAADGTILAFGLAVEDVRTDGDFTHYVWIATKDLASQDKIRATFFADRDKRSAEEQEAITHLFTSLTEPDAARNELNRSLIFHLPSPK
jgi:hypothetical protein